MLICSRCNRPIIPDWETYAVTDSGDIVHSFHGPRKSTIVLILAALTVLGVAAVALGDPSTTSSDRTCAESCAPP